MVYYIIYVNLYLKRSLNIKRVMNFIRKNQDKFLLTAYCVLSIVIYLTNGGDKLATLQKILMLLYVMFAIYFSLKRRDNTGLVYALLFTAMSDCLILSDTEISEFTRILGMVTFIIAQIFHMLFLNKECNKKTNIIFISIRLLLILLVLSIASILNMELNLLVIICTIYFVMLVMNFIQSLINSNKHVLMTVGYFLFIICDVFVGIDMGIKLNILAPFEGTLNTVFYSINTCDWVFYLLAQYFFVLYIATNKKYIK